MHSRTWSTDMQLPAHRFSYWRDEICHKFSIDIDRQPRQLKRQESFFGQLKTHELGPLLFTNTTVNACDISRSEQSIALDQKSHYQLTLIRSGKVRASQHNSTWELSSGDLILLDYNTPYNLSLSAQAQLFSVLIPSDCLERKAGKLCELFSKPAASKLGATSLAAEFMKILPSQLDQIDPLIENRIAEHVTDIVATTLLSAAEIVQPKASPALANVLRRALRLIDTDLDNCELSPEMVAATLGISVRYLSLAFASRGLTVMRYVRERRLDHCRNLLRDPAHKNRRISDIAYASGFGDLSLFNRSFRDRFGITPSQARLP